MTPSPSTADKSGGAPGAADGGYDRQLICALLESAADGAVILAQADALDRKQRDAPLASEVVALHGQTPADSEVQALSLALAGRGQVPQPLTVRSRLYLVGEGRPTERTLGGWEPAALAALLARAGLRDLALVSIVGAGAGRDHDRDDAGQTDDGAVSFASLLHRALKEQHGVVTVVNARVGAVQVLVQSQVSGATTIAAGRKLTALGADDQPASHHAQHSKLRLSWNGDRQLRSWAY